MRALRTCTWQGARRASARFVGDCAPLHVEEEPVVHRRRLQDDVVRRDGQKCPSRVTTSFHKVGGHTGPRLKLCTLSEPLQTYILGHRTSPRCRLLRLRECTIWSNSIQSRICWSTRACQRGRWSRWKGEAHVRPMRARAAVRSRLQAYLMCRDRVPRQRHYQREAEASCCHIRAVWSRQLLAPRRPCWLTTFENISRDGTCQEVRYW